MYAAFCSNCRGIVSVASYCSSTKEVEGYLMRQFALNYYTLFKKLPKVILLTTWQTGHMNVTPSQTVAKYTQKMFLIVAKCELSNCSVQIHSTLMLNHVAFLHYLCMVLIWRMFGNHSLIQGEGVLAAPKTLVVLGHFMMLYLGDWLLTITTFRQTQIHFF